VTIRPVDKKLEWFLNKKMDKKEFRVLIKHCYLMGKNTVQTKAWLDKCYPDSAPGKSTIIDWFAEFKRGRTKQTPILKLKINHFLKKV